MNRVKRLPLPVADYYVDTRWSAILGGGEDSRGPFKHYHEARKVAAAIVAPYPGQYGPSVKIRRVER